MTQLGPSGRVVRVVESEKQAPNCCFSGVTWQEMKMHHAGLGKSDREVGTKSRKGSVWEKEGYKQDKYGIYVEKVQEKIAYNAVRERQEAAVVCCQHTQTWLVNGKL